MVRISQILHKGGPKWIKHYMKVQRAKTGVDDTRPFKKKDYEQKNHLKYGPVIWRDYQSPFVEPPHWYKWSLKSPYSPEEQGRIRAKKDIGWHKHNYDKISCTPPDEWLFYVGDKVEILAGKDKGKQGEVVQIVPERNWVLVGGLNVKYTEDKDRVHAQEEPLEHHEVSLIDPKDSKATDVELKANEDGAQARVSTRSGHIIPKPLELLSDRTPKCEYVNASKDTLQDVALARTYAPSMKHWEDELKEVFKVNDPPTIKTFWY